MRLALSLFLLLCYSSMMSGQTVNGIKLDDLKTDYLLIYNAGTSFSRNIIINVDYGQGEKAFSNQTRLYNEEGSDRFLNSMIDAVNFFRVHGFEFIQAYVEVGEKDSETFYMLKRKSFSIPSKDQK